MILDAAEASMARSGPAGIRLQEVAEAAGVSHPTILHHFESREGLIRALNERALAELKTVLTEVMEAGSTSVDGVRATFAAYRQGFAQRVLWMLQTQAQGAARGPDLFDHMVDALHATRLQFAAPGVALDRADSEAIVHLITISAMGDALIGARLRRGGTPEEERARGERFERWLGDLLDRHIVMMGRADG